MAHREETATGGLIFNRGEAVADFFLFGFDDADGLFVDEKDVIGGADVGLVLADGDVRAGIEVERLFALDDGEELVNTVAGGLLGILIGAHAAFAGFPRLAGGPTCAEGSRLG